MLRAMQVHATKTAIRQSCAAFRQAGQSIGLVPTMGYLHEGHLTLVRAAKATCDRVVVTIFVNPTQFGPNEDLAKYPRDLDRDLAMLRAEGVDTVFTPEPAEMYVAGAETIVETTKLSRVLIGRLRPGHFRGVATVVSKLFHIIGPDQAFFGQKDYQQLAVINRMVRDLDFQVQITGVPTVREGDGIAMSSRNVRLTADDRAAAPVLYQALKLGEKLAGEGLTASKIAAAVTAKIKSEPRAAVQSVDLRDAETLQTLRGPLKAPAVILLAVKFGDVLLIDNQVVRPS
ncbi:MAG: pantoate--beta-alanine ligase [Deltaproteobacteria bacterium]